MKNEKRASSTRTDRFWQAIPNLSIWPRLMHLLGILGLRKLLKRAYRRSFGPNGGVVTLEAGNLTAKHYVHAQYIAESLKRLQGEREVLEIMMKTLAPGDCVFDIGAERGLFSLFLSQVVGDSGQVIAYEPYGDAYEVLQDNIRLNGLKNIKVLRLALSDYDGDARLFSGSPGYAPSLRDLHEIGVKMPAAERVHVAKGDTVRALLNLAVPKAVKIDVEGAELAVINGLAQSLADPACQLLCCEIHPKQLPEGITEEAIVARIRELHFDGVEVSPRGETCHAICTKSKGA